ncbi:NACHT domain-containing protein [Sphingobacterium prati]|uniref:NACHT domain-containing protein n=1 Tax=Sphingobacterium prati TaxID=2737006 RepID=UPI001555F69B|nr:NACHT domain-containing protein [Sphingobacterium prati]NPE48301.1 NACHT domain-containing protein [Sphingobacterium prati]
MEEKVLETLVVGFTKVLIEEAKTFLSDSADTAYDEIKQYIGKDLKNYLNKHKDKYSHVKTLLRGNTPVYLYDIYFPSKLLDNKKVISTESGVDFFGKYNCATIIGDAGSGKSTLVKHLFLNSIYERKYIPILIELRYLNEDATSLEDYIKFTCNLNKVNVNDNILERLLEKGKFVFFFDGFDELEEKIKQKIIKEINNFVNKYISNKFLITTRPYSNIENLPLFSNLRMKDLTINDGEIKGFVFKQLSQEVELAEKAYKSISQGDTHHIESFLKNPLLLSLYLLTFQSHASIPDKKYIFYRRVINALFSEHDSKTKLGFIREKQCGLDQEGFEEILKSFSFLSYFGDHFVFDSDYTTKQIGLIKRKKEIKFDTSLFLKDLKLAISLWVDDDGQLSFSHRSLQEYFCALFISELKDEENKRVYDKILKIFETRGRVGASKEIDNLLDLLREMDEYNFHKNFYLPMLNELNMEMNKMHFQTGGQILLNFFIEGFRMDSRDYKKVNGERRNDFALFLLRKKEIFKTIFVHIKFTRELDAYLYDELRKNKALISFIHPFISKKVVMFEDEVYNEVILTIEPNDGSLRAPQVRFGKLKLEEVYSYLDDKLLNRIYQNLISHLKSEILKSSQFIRKIEDNEKDLVDLI